jgi:hypothetical protein
MLPSAGAARDDGAHGHAATAGRSASEVLPRPRGMPNCGGSHRKNLPQKIQAPQRRLRCGGRSPGAQAAMTRGKPSFVERRETKATPQTGSVQRTGELGFPRVGVRSDGQGRPMLSARGLVQKPPQSADFRPERATLMLAEGFAPPARPRAITGTHSRCLSSRRYTRHLTRRCFMVRDGRELARSNELRVLKALYKYGWLRTRDLAVLLWMRVRPPCAVGFCLEPVVVDRSAWRMAQVTLARMRKNHLVISTDAPDGSIIYGLSEAGARHLVGLGIPAKSGKDAVRRVSLSHYHHRRLANEVAILASLYGYRVSTEAEIAAGLWFGGDAGAQGKHPDVVARKGKDVWLVEIERSRRNRKDYDKLLAWMNALFSPSAIADQAKLPHGYHPNKVVFVCEGAFIERLKADLQQQGWKADDISKHLLEIRLLYVTQAKFIMKRLSAPSNALENSKSLPGNRSQR